MLQFHQRFNSRTVGDCSKNFGGKLGRLLWPLTTGQFIKAKRPASAGRLAFMLLANERSSGYLLSIEISS